MRRIIRNFLRHDDGAVTVDWVVLAAVVVGVAVAVVGSVGTATNDLATELDTKVNSIEVRTHGGLD